MVFEWRKKMNSRIVKLIVLLLACLLVFALVGCGGGSKSNKDSIVVQIMGEPDSLDPQGSVAVVSFFAISQMNATLLKRAGDGFEPYIAESYTINEDSSAFHFILRDDVYFHNGEKLTADDVAFTMERGKNHPFQPMFYDVIDYVEVIAENECVIHLVRSYSPFESVLTSVQFPILSKKAEEDGVDFTREPVGAGPYVFKEWRTADSVEMTAFPDFFLGEAAIKDVSMKIISDPNTAYAALESGDLDFAFTVPMTAYDEIMDNKKLGAVEFVDSAWMVICLNHAMPEFQDLNVRFAMTHAINRDDMVLVAAEGKGFPSVIPAYEGLTGYIPGYESYPYDVALAKDYMAKSAYPGGFDVSFKCYDPKTQKVAEIAQTNLKEIGINVTVDFIDIGAAMSDMITGNYEVGVVPVANSIGDVDALKDLFGPGATLNIANTEDSSIYDKMVEAAAYTGEARLAILREAYDMMMEQCIYLPTFFSINFYGANSGLDVSGINVGSDGIVDVYSMKWK